MRRAVASAVGLGVLAVALLGAAQPAGRVARVGLLCAVRCEGPTLDEIIQ